MIKTKKIKSLIALKAQAQVVFNLFIRERDKDRGCISCGSPVTEAGHYFSAGHYSALRFNEVNVNGQCTRCNRFLHGNLINYRKGLVLKYGQAAIDKLELNADLRKATKWTRLELELIIKTYKPVKKVRSA